MKKEQETPVSREPDRLLENVNTSIFFKALVISCVVHVVFAGVTSFSLYRDWAEYGMFSEEHGLNSPSDLREIKTELAKTQKENEQNAKLEAQLQEQRKQAEIEIQDPKPEETPEAAPQDSTPEVPEVEPLPPKEFSLDDLPGLGD